MLEECKRGNGGKQEAGGLIGAGCGLQVMGDEFAGGLFVTRIVTRWNKKEKISHEEHEADTKNTKMECH